MNLNPFKLFKKKAGYQNAEHTAITGTEQEAVRQVSYKMNLKSPNFTRHVHIAQKNNHRKAGRPDCMKPVIPLIRKWRQILKDPRTYYSAERQARKKIIRAMNELVHRTNYINNKKFRKFNKRSRQKGLGFYTYSPQRNQYEFVTP
jgi:hypothetical protein